MERHMRNVRETAAGWSRRIGRAALAAGMLVAAMATPAVAEDGWDFTVGAAVVGETVYPGSGDRYVVPVPSLKATYTTGSLSGYASLLEGAGLTYRNAKTGLQFSLNLNGGDRRHRENYSVAGFSVDHSDATRQLLAGSPNLSTSIVTTAALDVLTPAGIVGVSVSHHPTSVSPADDPANERVRYGFLYSARYMAAAPVSGRALLSGLCGAEYMDARYADTWYSVPNATEFLHTFKADAGLRNLQIALQLDYRLSDRATLSAIGATTVLFGDANESPYTVERLQRSMSVQTSYSF